MQHLCNKKAPNKRARPGQARFMSRLTTRMIAAGVLLIILSGQLRASDPADSMFQGHWHQWRGPFANGQAPSSAMPPVTWDEETNVA